MFCVNCGSELRDDARYCQVCGMPTDRALPQNEGLTVTEGTMTEHVAEARGRSRGRIPLVLLVILVTLAVASAAFAAWAVWKNVVEPALSASSREVEAQAVDAGADADDKSSAQAIYSYEMTNVAPDGSENVDNEDQYAYWYPIISTTGDPSGVNKINAAIQVDAEEAWRGHVATVEHDAVDAASGAERHRTYRYHAYITQLDDTTVSLAYATQVAMGTIGTTFSYAGGHTYDLSTGSEVSASALANISDEELLALSEDVVADYYAAHSIPIRPSVSTLLDLPVQENDDESTSFDPVHASYCVLTDGIAISYPLPYGIGPGGLTKADQHAVTESITLFVRAFDGSDSNHVPGDVIDFDQVEAGMLSTFGEAGQS